jgi:hypothetical protein
MARRGSALRKVAVILCVGWLVSGGPLFAQNDVDPDGSGPDPERAAKRAALKDAIDRADEADRLMRETSIQTMLEFLSSTPNAAPLDSQQDRVRRLVVFRDALREFEASRLELFKADTAEPRTASIRKMEESTKGLLDFVKLINKKHPRLDTGQFKGFTNDALLKETLVTAARATPTLATVIVNEVSSKVDVKFMESLPQLELDLLRLQWMTRRLK